MYPRVMGILGVAVLALALLPVVRPIVAAAPRPTVTSVAALPPGFQNITHIVFIIKENRSFDHYFGRFPGADGATVGRTSTGEIVPLRPTARPGLARHRALVAGRLPRLRPRPHGPLQPHPRAVDLGVDSAYTQMRPQDIPAYWAYAQQFTLDDHFFSTIMGPTFPNHLVTIAAQSGGVNNNPVFANRPAYNDTSWGCDSPPPPM